MRTATFESTVDILVKAYLNDTLAHADCEMCAVGNICGGWGDWSNFFVTTSHVHDGDIVLQRGGGKISKRKTWFRDIDKENALEKQIFEKSGYDWKSLARIEFAFESAPRGKSSDDYMFNGLMAVVDVLASIHNVDLSIKENAKLLFVKSPN